MSKHDQKKLRDLRSAISEDPRYFEHYWEHFQALYGDDNIPEEFFVWEAMNEGYLKVLFTEDPLCMAGKYTPEQFALTSYTVVDFKSYQKRLDQEIDNLLR